MKTICRILQFKKPFLAGLNHPDRFYHRRGVRLVEKETCPTDMQHMHLYLFWGA